jgi:hypothetical protein
MSIKSLYPSIRPSLNLDFANSKALDGRITFTRTSTATYVGANGLIQTAQRNAPRFDHDPITGESLGLLIEEQRGNLYQQSSNMSNSYWGPIGATLTASAGIAPDGTNTAVLMKTDTSTGSHRLIPNTGIATVQNTVSMFLKTNGDRYLAVRADNQSNWCTFDLVDGVISNASTNNNTTARIVAYPNGWYRCIVSYLPGATGNDPEFYLANSATGYSGGYTGTGTNGIYIWGFQLEAGSFATSYIPTSGSAATRPADTVSISGSNFSNWYNPTEGTIFYDNPVSIGSDTFGWIIHGGSNTIRYGFNNSNGVPFVESNGGTDFGTNPTVLSGGGTMTYAYKSSDYAVYGDGTKLGGSGPSSVISGAYELAIGFRGSYSPSSYMTGTIKKLAYYPKRLTNAQLQTLTQ